MHVANVMSKDALVVATGDAKWSSIDELVDRLDGAGFWSDAFVADAERKAKKQYVRQAMRRVVDENGWPTFASVVTVDPATGEEHRVYKQEAFFEGDDYRQVVAFNVERVNHHWQMAIGYADRARVRYGVQIPLNLPVTQLDAAAD